MAHITSRIEYGIHCLLWLASSGETPLSSRDLAELQGVSPSFLAKIFPKLEKAGIVSAQDGVRGGYRLARPMKEITFLDIVDAIEGHKPLFDCQEIRERCALFEGVPPKWATQDVCSIHAVILKAEQAMRDELASHSLADISQTVTCKAPNEFPSQIQEWIAHRVKSRKPGRPLKPPDPISS
ncbi:MAG: Rrf2 family transcriptional regulator [Magnetococcales bacterium]|nr:Rrf2 family transcriptional regulator [Magnetococcales bacterium]